MTKDKPDYSLPFGERAIENLKSNFVKEDGTYMPFKKYGFKNTKGTKNQGLRLFHYCKSKNKAFYLQYKYNNVSKYHFLGLHSKNFTLQDVQNKIAKLRSEFGVEDTLQFKVDLKIADKKSKLDFVKNINEEISEYKINDVIELVLKDDCPRLLKGYGGTNTSKTTKKFLRTMLGSGPRRDFLRLQDDLTGNGHIYFKDFINIEGKRCKNEIKEWGDLFKTYPSTFYKRKEESIKNNPNLTTESIYDNAIGQLPVKDLTRAAIVSYIDLFKSVSQKKLLKDTFALIWNYAYEKNMVSIEKNNPTYTIRIKTKPQEHNNPNHSKYNLALFRPEELSKILETCDRLRAEKQFPFQTNLIKLLMFTGKRKEQLLKLKWEDVKYFESPEIIIGEDSEFEKIWGFMEIDKDINKNRTKKDFIAINDCINEVLVDLKKEREDENPWTRFVPWMFPSPRVKDKAYLTKSNQISDHSSRLKDFKLCWDMVRDITGIGSDGKARMFRNTFDTKLSHLSPNSITSIKISGHSTTQVFDAKYVNKTLTESDKKVIVGIGKYFQQISSTHRKKLIQKIS